MLENDVYDTLCGTVPHLWNPKIHSPIGKEGSANPDSLGCREFNLLLPSQENIEYFSEEQERHRQQIPYGLRRYLPLLASYVVPGRTS